MTTVTLGAGEGGGKRSNNVNTISHGTSWLQVWDSIYVSICSIELNIQPY